MNKPSEKAKNAPDAQPAQTVFVVDDDEQVRRSIDQLGRSVGLKVVAFASANKFLQEVCGNKFFQGLFAPAGAVN